MRIIISPAKKMNVDCDTLEFHNLPVFIEETTKIMDWIKTLSFKEKCYCMKNYYLKEFLNKY